MLSKKKLNVLAMAFMLCSSYLHGQSIVRKDPAIAAMVAEISSDSLKSYIGSMVSFGTRHTLSTQTDAMRGIGAARQWVLQKLMQFGKNAGSRFNAVIDTTTLQPDQRRIDAPAVLGNVIATLKGTDTADHRIFIIGGHLDNMRSNVMDRSGDAPGANDDASGVAAVLECARIMSLQKFPATIIFVAFSGEEQGLLGANFLARKAKSQQMQIEAVLNNDIVGSNNSSETNLINNMVVRVFSEGLPAYETAEQAKSIRQLGLENDGRARQLARYVKETGERYVDNFTVMMVYRNDRFLRGGDHIPFVENGFAAVRLTEANENYHHQHQDVRMENNIQYGDLPQFLDYHYLAKNTAVNLSTLANLAKAPAQPQDVKIDVKKLGNSTRLYWTKPLTGKTLGYFVMMRETTSAVWQKKFYTLSDEMILPYSKDNYFFAVQSVSADGNESLPVVPAVGR